MDERYIEILANLNTAFYEGQAASFSDSRQTPWPGWERCLKALLDDEAFQASGQPIGVLDVACGNMRFEQFLAQHRQHAEFHVTAVDNCDALACPVDHVTFAHADVVGMLREGKSLQSQLGSGFDVAVSFGFMHHVPSRRLRERFLDELLACVKPGGLVAVSLWRFMENEHLAEKALADTRAATETLEFDGLGQNDYLLGWNNKPGVWRYCHHFDDGEVDELVAHVDGRAAFVDRFLSDGRDNQLNCYLVLRKL